MVTNVGKSEAGDLQIEFAIRNDTGDWSTMHAVADKPAVFTTSDGKTTNCDTVFAGTGGHRLAPGFQMRGYTVGEAESPTTSLFMWNVKVLRLLPGSTLAIEYVSFGGELDDYDPEANKTEGILELNLDEVVTDLTYPVASPVEGLILKPGDEITALSDNVITLLDVQRTDTGFQFTWQNYQSHQISTQNPHRHPAGYRGRRYHLWSI